MFDVDFDVIMHAVVVGFWTGFHTHAGTAEPFRVSPPEAVLYINGIKWHALILATKNGLTAKKYLRFLVLRPSGRQLT